MEGALTHMMKQKLEKTTVQHFRAKHEDKFLSSMSLYVSNPTAKSSTYSNAKNEVNGK